MLEPQQMTSEISVLDFGSVRYIDHMGGDLMVVNAARVSFAKESLEFIDKDVKLINYLAKNNHWTPFAHPQITLHIKAPISIRTQLFKHKVGFVENEVSRRYVREEPEFYLPQWRASPTDGAKQGSSDFMTDVQDLSVHTNELYKASFEAYQMLLERGVAPEQARFVLPQGTYTEWYWTGSLSAYARVCKLRLDPHAQWEVRQYAAAFAEIIEPLFPHSWKALMGNP